MPHRHQLRQKIYNVGQTFVNSPGDHRDEDGDGDDDEDRDGDGDGHRQLCAKVLIQLHPSGKGLLSVEKESTTPNHSDHLTNSNYPDHPFHPNHLTTARPTPMHTPKCSLKMTTNTKFPMLNDHPVVSCQHC